MRNSNSLQRTGTSCHPLQRVRFNHEISWQFWGDKETVKVKSLSRVWLFVTPCPWDSPSKNTGVGCHFLLQRIFLTQGLNPGLPQCRQTLYHLSHQGLLEDSGLPRLCSSRFFTTTFKRSTLLRSFKRKSWNKHVSVYSNTKSFMTHIPSLKEWVKDIFNISAKREVNIEVYGRKNNGKLTMQDGEGNGTPLQCSCLENPMDGGAW